jgi:broad specificity phosphatase PhoE
VAATIASRARVFFVRHGESESNVLRQFSNRGNSHPLTARGRVQVATLAEKLANENINRIYSSPLLRARQSAELLSARLDAPWQPEDALREYDVGTFEGTTSDSNWQTYERVLAAWLLRHERAERTGEGESFADIEARFVPFVERLLANLPPRSSVALVGHGGLFRCMLPRVLENVTYRFALRNTLDHTSWVLAIADADKLVCRQWGTRPVSATETLDDHTEEDVHVEPA